MQTRLRSSSNSQERRNSVSDITDFFQAKVNCSPAMPNHTGRKASGRNKDKEKEKELKAARENIKAFISKMDSENANGAEELSAINSEKSVDHDREHDREQSDHVEQLTQHEQSPQHESVKPSDYDTSKTNSDASTLKDNSKSTQTSEDEIIKALHELASKYQTLDDSINDPKNGISQQLAKTSNTVTSIYSEIYGAVSGIKVQLEQVTKTAQANSEKITQMENSQKRMAALLEENKRIVRELKIMQGLVQKVSQKSESNANQVLDLTKRGMEQNLILHGVDDSIETQDHKEQSPMFTFKERPKHSALKFFKEELNLDMEVEDVWKAHRSGPFKKDKVRPLIVRLSYTAKDLVMENVGNLKGRTNPKTKQKYFVSEQIPEGITEMQKQTKIRIKPLKETNDKKSQEDKDNIQVVGDKILINGEVKQPDVITPTPEQLFLSTDNQNKVDEIQAKFVETDTETLRNSEFSALAIKVHSLEEINRAYIAVMQRYPAMDHIMLGYALKQDGKIKSGFADDREFGAGTRIKDLIFQTKTKNAAVFVLRKFGGVHLGFQRFAVIERAAEKAIELLNINYK